MYPISTMRQISLEVYMIIHLLSRLYSSGRHIMSNVIEYSIHTNNKKEECLSISFTL